MKNFKTYGGFISQEKFEQAKQAHLNHRDFEMEGILNVSKTGIQLELKTGSTVSIPAKEIASLAIIRTPLSKQLSIFYFILLPFFYMLLLQQSTFGREYFVLLTLLFYLIELSLYGPLYWLKLTQINQDGQEKVIYVSSKWRYTSYGGKGKTYKLFFYWLLEWQDVRYMKELLEDKVE